MKDTGSAQTMETWPNVHYARKLAHRSMSEIKYTGEEVSIDKQVACEKCRRWLVMTEVACEETTCKTT